MENTPKGFISFNDLMELLSRHTEKEPLVDLRRMAKNRDYIEHGHTFTVPLMAIENGKRVDKGIVWVMVRDDRDKYNLRGAIKDAVKRTMDIDLNLDVNPIVNSSTVIDPDTNAKGRPTNNDPLAKDLGYNYGYDTRI